MEPDQLFCQLFSQVQQKTISAIYEVDFEENPGEPFQYLICFHHSPVFLDVENANDADHVHLHWRESTELEQYLQTLTVAGLWTPRSVGAQEPLGSLLGCSLTHALYAKEKTRFIINGTWLQGDPLLYSALRLACDAHTLTVFSNGEGLYAGVNTNLKPPFEETYDWYACD
jgi:hypothetical protein